MCIVRFIKEQGNSGLLKAKLPLEELPILSNII